VVRTARKRKPAPLILDQAWRRLAPLLQLDFFEDKGAASLRAFAELQALERRLKGDQKSGCS
jgi:hypothetical protein